MHKMNERCNSCVNYGQCIMNKSQGFSNVCNIYGYDKYEYDVVDDFEYYEIDDEEVKCNEN